MHRGDSFGEDGFTLVELLIVLIILPIIAGGIAIALITSLKDQTGISARLASSSDAQITSAFYTRDVQSAFNVTTDQSGSLSPPLCGSGGSLVGAMDWNGGQTVVTYWNMKNGTTWDLVRRACIAGVNGGAPVSTTVSHNLPNPVAPLKITCSNTAITCRADRGWISTVGVSNISFSSSGALTYNLAAAPRNWTPQGGGVPPGGSLPSLLLLGASPDNTSCPSSGGDGDNDHGGANSANALLSIDHNATLTVNVGAGSGNGVVAVNSAQNGSIWFCNDSMLTAAQIESEIAPPNTSKSVSSQSADYVNTASANITYVAGGVPDPRYVPPAVPSSSTSSTSCRNDACTPREYKNTLSISEDTTFCPGVYYFDDGITVSDGVTLSAGSDEDCGGTGGVLFYVHGGTATFGAGCKTGGGGGGDRGDGGDGGRGGCQGVTVSLTPIAQYTGSGGQSVTNQSVLVFQDTGDSNLLSLGINGSGGHEGGDGQCQGDAGRDGGEGSHCGSMAIGGLIARSFSITGGVAVSVGGSGTQDYPGTIYAPGAPVEVVSNDGGGDAGP
jgi:prepilin-type N-terminal cleavage/methylation domain-containing protein